MWKHKYQLEIFWIVVFFGTLRQNYLILTKNYLNWFYDPGVTLHIIIRDSFKVLSNLALGLPIMYIGTSKLWYCRRKWYKKRYAKKNIAGKIYEEIAKRKLYRNNYIERIIQIELQKENYTKKLTLIVKHKRNYINTHKWKNPPKYIFGETNKRVTFTK